ncbi:hypothetical protein DY240_12825 [Jiangella rhizosphaerae]|uniref:Uncharacterized protein n=1 Tax=Jiangella rhizosphaerae TaxID=2293569 RepID=A0A418KQY4_9ACTN|nr:hypothetical protein DY240_12825 [Jiangella rhizosphaerae]
MSRLLVLAALLLGIVLMHHVAGAGHADGHSPAHEPAAAAHAEGHDGEPSPSPSGHELVHLCLAVLTAAVLVLAGRVLLRRLPPLARRARDAVVTWPARRVRPPPRLYGSALLTSLCVLRT